MIGRLTFYFGGGFYGFLSIFIRWRVLCIIIILLGCWIIQLIIGGGLKLLWVITESYELHECTLCILKKHLPPRKSDSIFFHCTNLTVTATVILFSLCSYNDFEIEIFSCFFWVIKLMDIFIMMYWHYNYSMM